MHHRSTKGSDSEIVELEKTHNIAIGLAMGIFSSAMLATAIREALVTDNTLRNSAWLSLLSATLFVSFFWYYSPRQNIKIMRTWFSDTPLRRNPQFETAVGFGIAVLFGLMMFFSSQPLIYSTIFTVYCVFYFLGVRHFHNRVRYALDRKRGLLQEETKLNKKYREVLDVLDRYFLKRPHLFRIGAMAVSGVFAFGIALGQKLNLISWGDLASSVLLTLTLFVQEVFIIMWRNERDRVIDTLEEEYNSILDNS